MAKPFPLLVVTAITPFPALEPYNAEAAAPFTTSIDSTSSAFKSAKVPLMIAPSTTINGADEVFKLLSPLNKISIDWPGAPPDEEAFKPATLPDKAEDKEDGGTAVNCSAVILVTDTVIFSFCVAPATPVTITSLNTFKSGCKLTFTSAPLTVFSTDTKPMDVKTNTSPFLALI
ncbi:hypothetical protein D9M68_604890 [compost metagenome]